MNETKIAFAQGLAYAWGRQDAERDFGMLNSHGRCDEYAFALIRERLAEMYRAEQVSTTLTVQGSFIEFRMTGRVMFRRNGAMWALITEAPQGSTTLVEFPVPWSDNTLPYWHQVADGSVVGARPVHISVLPSGQPS